MMTKIKSNNCSAEKTVRDIRQEGINTNLYYRWSKDFLEAGKKRLAGDTTREATFDEIRQLRTESAALKEALAEQVMGNRLLKKSVIGDAWIRYVPNL